MLLIPRYNWTLRHVADDIGAGTSTVWQWRKQLEIEGIIAQKDDLNDTRTPEQIFTILLETAALPEHAWADTAVRKGCTLSRSNSGSITALAPIILTIAVARKPSDCSAR